MLYLLYNDIAQNGHLPPIYWSFDDAAPLLPRAPLANRVLKGVPMWVFSQAGLCAP